MRQSIKDYIKQLDKLYSFKGVFWWIIDYEYDPSYFYCNEYMKDTFSLDKNLKKHSIELTCPIVGDYNKNIELVEDSRGKAKLVFEEYNQLINQKVKEYSNQFPYYNESLDKTFYFSSRAKVLEKNKKGELSILFGVIVDITSSEKQKKELEKLSQTDKLTALYNRFKLDESLNIEVDRMKREKAPLSLIMVDIDKFKTINDNYGHLIGDKVIVQVSKILKNNTRKVDVIGRWGGEEFMILCPNTTIKAAIELAKKLRKIIAKAKFETKQKETASFGVSQFEDGDDVDSFINRADHALYRAKDNGRNRVEVLNKNENGCGCQKVMRF